MCVLWVAVDLLPEMHVAECVQERCCECVLDSPRLITLSWNRGITGSFPHKGNAWDSSLLQSRGQLLLQGWVLVVESANAVRRASSQEKTEHGRFGEGKEFLSDGRTQCLRALGIRIYQICSHCFSCPVI